MKKLLGILGTITIAGSGTAGIVANAPEKNNINYQQTSNNNLEKLNRKIREIKYKEFNKYFSEIEKKIQYKNEILMLPKL
jgi:predicted sulfurtransferase